MVVGTENMLIMQLYIAKQHDKTGDKTASKRLLSVLLDTLYATLDLASELIESANATF